MSKLMSEAMSKLRIIELPPQQCCYLYIFTALAGCFREDGRLISNVRMREGRELPPLVPPKLNGDDDDYMEERDAGASDLEMKKNTVERSGKEGENRMKEQQRKIGVPKRFFSIADTLVEELRSGDNRKRSLTIVPLGQRSSVNSKIHSTAPSGKTSR